jgi:hypothetical protein
MLEYKVSCPYCGEQLSILIDGSVGQQEYIEDCQVCCRPMTIRVELAYNGDSYVVALHEDE